MKFLYFDHPVAGNWRLGVLKGDAVVDVTAAVSDLPHSDPRGDPRGLINAVIAHYAACKAVIESAATSGTPLPLADVRLRPPLPLPRQIDCMARNYMEDGTLTEPPEINGFHKSPSAIIGYGDTMVLPDVAAGIFEGEAELALVIGTRATNVSAADAMDHVFGYMNFIDGSARDLPPAGNTFFQVKSRDTFAPIGPYLVTADEVPDPHGLPVRLTVNGTVMQGFSTSDMAHKIPRCIEWLSSIHTLEPGDIVATGTNHRGLNAFQDGDRVELEVGSLGLLRVHVSDPLKRNWARDTRLQHKEKGLPGPYTPQLTGKYAATGD
ncbi:MAG: fumarylacetoacetate hydrolase family protein [Alphaproteobacteria bacterium]|nr:fumarylacetoacetate hydrolase family protein [Alphaproteobacteria bacterium]